MIVLMMVAVGQSCLVVRITILGIRAGTVLEVDSGDAFLISSNCFKTKFQKRRIVYM